MWPTAPVATSHTEYEWLHSAFLEFGPADSYGVFFGRNTSGGNCQDGYRSCHLIDSAVEQEFGDSAHLAHELGHGFSLEHPHEVWMWDPAVGWPTVPVKRKTDMWDLFYCPGSSAGAPNQFFNRWAASTAAGTCAEAARLPLAVNAPMSNCVTHTLASCASSSGTALPLGQRSCKLQGAGGYCEPKSNFDTSILNALTFSGNDDTAAQQFGVNMMAYDDDPATRSKYRSFSPSQTRIIRAVLRHDRRAAVGIRQFDPAPPYQGKPRLGSVSARLPLQMLDFNGDGLRDVAVWKSRPNDAFAANSADWVIRLAPAFAATIPTLRFGRLDDVPVPALYDNDSITDQAVYRAGETGPGGTTDPSTWYWCPSGGLIVPPNCEFSGFAGQIFGTREDIPLPGLKLAAWPARHLAVFRPSNGTFYWQAVGGGAVSSVQVAVPGSRSVPLPGLYDADDLVDFATYDVVNARFDLVLSSGWRSHRDARGVGISADS